MLLVGNITNWHLVHLNHVMYRTQSSKVCCLYELFKLFVRQLLLSCRTVANAAQNGHTTFILVFFVVR